MVALTRVQSWRNEGNKFAWNESDDQVATCAADFHPSRIRHHN
jgi:hypothetical protein